MINDSYKAVLNVLALSSSFSACKHVPCVPDTAAQLAHFLIRSFHSALLFNLPKFYFAYRIRHRFFIAKTLAIHAAWRTY